MLNVISQSLKNEHRSIMPHYILRIGLCTRMPDQRLSPMPLTSYPSEIEPTSLYYMNGLPAVEPCHAYIIP